MPSDGGRAHQGKTLRDNEAYREQEHGIREGCQEDVQKTRYTVPLPPQAYGSPDFVLEDHLLLLCDHAFWHGRNWKKLKQRLAADSNPEDWVRHIGNNRRRDRGQPGALGTWPRRPAPLGRRYPETAWWCAERILCSVRRILCFLGFSSKRSTTQYASAADADAIKR